MCFPGGGETGSPPPKSCVFLCVDRGFLGGRGIAHRLPPHNVGMYLGGRGTGLLPRNVGHYIQARAAEQFSITGCTVSSTDSEERWKKRGMHYECKTCWWRGVPGSVSSMSASRGAPALRMRMLTRAILTSVNNSKHVSVNVPFGVIWTRVAGHTGNKMLVNNASVGSLVTATHLEENSSVASWGEGVAVEPRFRCPRGRPLKGLSGQEFQVAGLCRQSRVVQGNSAKPNVVAVRR